MKSNEFICYEAFNNKTLFWARLHEINIVSLQHDLDVIERGLANNKLMKSQN